MARPCKTDVIALYRHTLSRTGPVATLIEWDNDVPAFDVLLGEAVKRRRACSPTRQDGATVARRRQPEAMATGRHPAAIRRGAARARRARRPGMTTARGTPDPARFAVYRNNVIAGLTARRWSSASR